MPDLPTINFEELLREFIKTLGVQEMAYPDGSQIAVGAPFTKPQLAKRLTDADYEIRVKICQAQDNPHRAKYYLGDLTDWLADNAMIPDRVADYSVAKIKLGSAADQTAINARLAISLYEIEKVERAPQIYGSPVNLFYVHAGRVRLVDKNYRIRFDLPTLGLVDDTLFAPYEYKWGVLALAVTKCFYPGTNETHRAYWTNMWNFYRAEIENRAMNLPEPDQLKRIGA